MRKWEILFDISRNRYILSCNGTVRYANPSRDKVCKVLGKIRRQEMQMHNDIHCFAWIGEQK